MIVSDGRLKTLESVQAGGRKPQVPHGCIHEATIGVDLARHQMPDRTVLRSVRRWRWSTAVAVSHVTGALNACAHPYPEYAGLANSPDPAQYCLEAYFHRLSWFMIHLRWALWIFSTRPRIQTGSLAVRKGFLELVHQACNR